MKKVAVIVLFGALLFLAACWETVPTSAGLTEVQQTQIASEPQVLAMGGEPTKTLAPCTQVPVPTIAPATHIPATAVPIAPVCDSCASHGNKGFFVTVFVNGNVFDVGSGANPFWSEDFSHGINLKQQIMNGAEVHVVVLPCESLWINDGGLNPRFGRRVDQQFVFMPLVAGASSGFRVVTVSVALENPNDAPWASSATMP